MVANHPAASSMDRARLASTYVVGPDGKILAAHVGPLSLSRLERMVLK